MRRTFHDLVTEFGNEQGCAISCPEGSCQAKLEVEGFTIHLGLAEDTGMLLVQTGVGLLPQHDREPLLLRLLSANNLFRETFGMTLGADTGQELVTLQFAWSMRGLDKETFANLMANMATASARWLQLLHQEGGNANGIGGENTPASDDMLPPLGMIRV